MQRWRDNRKVVGGEEGVKKGWEEESERGGLTRNKLVPLQIVNGALLQKHVRLVEEDHGIPGGGDLKGVGEFGLHGGRVGAEVSGGDGVEGDFHFFGDFFVWSGSWLRGWEKGKGGIPDSMVRVLPTPGGPSRSITIPRPR